MGYIKNNNSLIGKKVVLTQEKKSMMGKFTVGSIVTITEETPMRGYTFADDEGNRISEAGYDGFKVI